MTPAMRAFVELLLVQISEMQAEIDELKAQVRKLTPKNSSIPFDSASACSSSGQAKNPNQKKRGVQNGHNRTLRELVPVEKCAAMIPLFPTECRRFGEGLKRTDAEPLRHQVGDLPKIERLITEYQSHRRHGNNTGQSIRRSCGKSPEHKMSLAETLQTFQLAPAFIDRPPLSVPQPKKCKFRLQAVRPTPRAQVELQRVGSRFSKTHTMTMEHHT